MRTSAFLVLSGILGSALMLGPAAVLAESEPGESEDVLVVRYASLIGGRNGGDAPTAAGVLSREALSDFLLEWRPDVDNQEVQEVFALNDLGELARQAMQLPLEGGVASGVYAHGDLNFEIEMAIRPARTIDSGDEVMTVQAEIKRNGELVAGPMIHTRLGDRAIITSGAKPDGPFLFLVVEIDRMSAEELKRRGLRHSWRKDFKLVDGDEVTSPKVVYKTQPAYPEEAREAKHQGRVVLRMVINDQGTVEDVEVVEGQPYGLNEAAIEAASAWRFEPALHQGEPVAVLYLVTINFRLE